MKKVLIINAHQPYEGVSEGRLNQTMVDTATEALKSRGCEVRHTKVSDGYDINEEQEKHLWADLIITQSPVFWFGIPWLHKKYIDEVFTAGLIEQTLCVSDGRTRQDDMKQYGSGGKMQGRKHMLSLTWNAPEAAFGNEEQNLLQGKTEDDVFLPVSSVYKFCGAEILPSFSCYDVMKSPEVEKDLQRLRMHINENLKN